MKRALFLPAVIGLALAAGVWVVEPAPGSEPPSAKNIFESGHSTFGASSEPGPSDPGDSNGPAEQVMGRGETPTGLRYTIRLLEDGDSLLVPNTRVFRSGDQIQLLLTSNVDAYLAILQVTEDSSMDLLYPNTDLGLVKNRVRAHKQVVFPGPEHGFSFVDEPGTERLLVVLAQTKQQLDKLDLQTRIASTRGSKLLNEAKRLAGDKRLQIVEVARSEEATYAVSIGGGLVLQEIRLTHR